jgi:hypothetical protein
MNLLFFLRHNFFLDDKNFVFFFNGLFITTILSYSNSILPFLPNTIAGFNWSGIAWIVMLFVTLILLVYTNRYTFPFYIWMPWVLYLFFYVLIDFSLIGLQLTIQYILPILIGVVASQFEYTEKKLLFLFQCLIKTLIVIYILFIIYYFTRGYSSNLAATPMFFSIGAVIGLAFFFDTREIRYLLLYFLLFLMPFLSLTRMGILVFGSIFILHFSNKGILSKLLVFFVGSLLLLLIINSKGFQEKTFRGRKGSITELSFDYYNNKNINTNGRTSLLLALERGLKLNPIWGNGPRADAKILGSVLREKTGEAHNDYLSVTYNYGFVGLGLLLFGFIASFFQLLIMSRNMKLPLFQLIVCSQLTLFIPFFLFMYSDNILKYTIWFPNYFFALMGICYSIYTKKLLLNNH